ncbi:MAG: aspartate carbamoyltransferase regulatory subunit [Clostridia bacterium]|nr:aspartate carbamoyltransferase regulatory subunit [Clostridia bacterium]
MHIDSIKEGIVIDHITAGNAMTIYTLLGFDKLECSIAIIKNVSSKKMGKKDIIKIDSNIDINLEALGYIDPGVTIDIIKDSVLVEKRSVDLPEKLHGVLKCKNPRCITSCEQELEQVFVLTDKDKKIYRCMYCEAKA